LPIEPAHIIRQKIRNRAESAHTGSLMADWQQKVGVANPAVFTANMLA